VQTSLSPQAHAKNTNTGLYIINLKKYPQTKLFRRQPWDHQRSFVGQPGTKQESFSGQPGITKDHFWCNLAQNKNHFGGNLGSPKAIVCAIWH
jgi:hypothetical protein